MKWVSRHMMQWSSHIGDLSGEPDCVGSDADGHKVGNVPEDHDKLKGSIEEMVRNRDHDHRTQSNREFRGQFFTLYRQLLYFDAIRTEFLVQDCSLPGVHYFLVCKRGVDC